MNEEAGRYKIGLDNQNLDCSTLVGTGVKCEMTSSYSVLQKGPKADRCFFYKIKTHTVRGFRGVPLRINFQIELSKYLSSVFLFFFFFS